MRPRKVDTNCPNSDQEIAPPVTGLLSKDCSAKLRLVKVPFEFNPRLHTGGRRTSRTAR